MKDLYRYLSPFAPDISGAVSVLFELGGLIVICDAGGCTGNTCGFDEPRWYTKSSAIYSAGLRDLDAILGRDEKLLDKIGQALESVPEARFIALIGTPVPAVIATDYTALCRMCEKRFHKKSIYIETTGMKDYTYGQVKAYRALINCVEEKPSEDCIGLWGCSPLDLPSLDSVQALMQRLGKKCIPFGMDDSLENYTKIAACKENIVLSPSGLTIAKELGLNFRFDYCLGKWEVKKKKTLILHQQILANALREAIGMGDVASFFPMDPEYMQANDRFLEGEMDLIGMVKENAYERIIGDPLFLRACQGFAGQMVSLPHFAVSGQMYQVESDATYWAQVKEALSV